MRRLSAREGDVAQAVARGRTNREIADMHGISVQTVKNHLTSAFLKVGVSNRLQLALFVVEERKS
jgi:DNA-binding CsgD family transcriptional regulator